MLPSTITIITVAMLNGMDNDFVTLDAQPARPTAQCDATDHQSAGVLSQRAPGQRFTSPLRPVSMWGASVHAGEV